MHYFTKSIPAVIVNLLLICVTFSVAAEIQTAIDFYEAGRHTQAQEILATIIEAQPEDDQAHLYMGRTYYDMKNYDPALEYFLKAVELDDNVADNHFWLGALYGRKAQKASIFKRIGLAKKSKRGFLRAIELDPEHVRCREALVRFYVQAPGIVGGGMDKAYAETEEIKKRNSVWAHRAYAKIYDHEKEYQKAEREHLAAIEEESDNPDIYYNLCEFYLKIEDFENAHDIMEKMLRELPEEVGGYYQIGRIGAISGKNLDRAEQCLKDYLQSDPREDDPSFAWTNYRLGMVYAHKGDKTAARECYQTALKQDPDHKEAKKALKKLK